jgi:hypothetical protein
MEMGIIGHRYEENYSIVDKMLRDRAIQRIIFGEKSDGKSLSFVEVLED